MNPLRLACHLAPSIPSAVFSPPRVSPCPPRCARSRSRSWQRRRISPSAGQSRLPPVWPWTSLPPTRCRRVPTPPEFADAFPSERRPSPPDLLLTTEDETEGRRLRRICARPRRRGQRRSGRRCSRPIGRRSSSIRATPNSRSRSPTNWPAGTTSSAGIQVLKDTIKAAPKEPLPYIYLSQLYAKNLNKPDLALKYAEQALALAPDNFAAHLARYELYIASGQTQESRASPRTRRQSRRATDAKLLGAARRSLHAALSEGGRRAPNRRSWRR